MKKHRRTNRYRKPEKRAAYDTAREMTEGLTNDALWEAGMPARLVEQVLEAHPGLKDVQQVVAKALRVERGRRGI